MGKAKIVRPKLPADVAAAFVHVVWNHIGMIEQRIPWKDEGFDFPSGSGMLLAVLGAIEDALPAKRNTPEFNDLVETARREAVEEGA